MKRKDYNSLGVTAHILVYESVAEGDAAAGVVDAVLGQCNDNLSYRGALADFRDQFVPLVEEATGVSRKQVQAKDKDGKPKTEEVEENGKKVQRPVMVPDETEGKYIARVRAEKGLTDEEAWKAFAQPLADKVGVYEEQNGQLVRTGDLAVDIKEPERKARGPVKLPEKFRVSAENIIKNGNAATWAEKLKAEGHVLADLTGDAAKDAQILGWAIKAREDAKQKAALAAEYN